MRRTAGVRTLEALVRERLGAEWRALPAADRRIIKEITRCQELKGKVRAPARRGKAPGR